VVLAETIRVVLVQVAGVLVFVYESTMVGEDVPVSSQTIWLVVEGCWLLSKIYLGQLYETYAAGDL